MTLNPSFWAGRRVLVTGHTGFKGSWLGLWLNSLKCELTCLGLEPENLSTSGKSFFDCIGLASTLGSRHFVGDIRDYHFVQRVVEASDPSVVIHLAAQSLVRRSYQDPIGTWEANVLGSLNLIEALRGIGSPCAVVMVTTDKVYCNREWDFGYREADRLGGKDPYSASKAAAEIAISSWRDSFCGTAPHQTPFLHLATARAGNVIGGGDWAADRIIPDAVRALSAGVPIPIRNPMATRPWQHVLEPLGGYLLLAEKLHGQASCFGRLETHGYTFASAFNFGPYSEANRPVVELIEAALQLWPGSWINLSDSKDPHEAGRLHLQIDKAHHQLGWQPRWDFATTVARTVGWYRAVHEGANPLECCLADLEAYQKLSPNVL